MNCGTGVTANSGSGRAAESEQVDCLSVDRGRSLASDEDRTRKSEGVSEIGERAYRRARGTDQNHAEVFTGSGKTREGQRALKEGIDTMSFGLGGVALLLQACAGSRRSPPSDFLPF